MSLALGNHNYKQEIKNTMPEWLISLLTHKTLTYKQYSRCCMFIAIRKCMTNYKITAVGESLHI